MAALEMEGNASSPHKIGQKLRSFIETARKRILEGVEAKKLVFTSGGTEANALALSGLGTIPVLVSSIEHDSVLKGARNPQLVPVTESGVIDLKALKELLSMAEKPGLLSVMLVNNETGVIQPVQEAARLAHAKGWKVHTDASQAVGHTPVSFKSLGVDLMTLSSHKCGGPVGVGALLLREDLHLQPLLRGGGQEYGMRSGTLATGLILGFEAALSESLGEDSSRLQAFQEKIEAALPEAHIYGKESPRTSHVVCLGMAGISADFQLISFDLKGIAVSAGSACSSGKMKESHVLGAMGIPPHEARCAIRVSMGWKTEESEVSAFVQAWKDIYDQHMLKEVS